MTAIGSIALLACATAAAPAGAASVTSADGSGQHAGVTLWRATSAACPSKPSTSARPGAVVAGRHHDCVRLVRRVMTIDRAKAAHAEPQQGSHDWDVVVTFSAHQKREFGRVTTAAVGHELAILDNARLISAPTVAEPIHSGTLEITGLTKAHARRLAHALNSG